MTPVTVGSLFSGIGGFDLGFERADFVVKWQVEIDPYCRRVLAKHWPNVKRHDDVKTFPPKDTKAEAWKVDCIIGGFPCQDVSLVGRGEGIDGARSGLWREYARIVRVVRPRFVVVENVPALLGRGMCRVLGDLAACGYDAEWDCFPSCAFGAPHIRDRLFLVGHAVPVAEVPHSDGERFAEQHAAPVANEPRILDWATEAARIHGWNPPTGVEPVVGRMAHGISNRVDRLAGLGNAVVPEVAEWVGRQLMNFIKHGEK